MRVRQVAAATLIAAVAVSLPACSSKRQISVEGTGSERVQGTSWYRFCDGPNAFIWIQSKTDSEPDELEAVIYDHWACVDPSTANDTQGPTTTERDEDGIVGDEDD